jgi:hypothetical protein
MLAHDRAEERVERVSGVRRAAAERGGPARRGRAERGPVGSGLCRSVGRGQREDRSGRKLANVAVHARGRRDVVVAQELRDGVHVQRVVERGMPAKGLQLGAEKQRAAGDAVVERLDPNPVADQVQCLLGAVPDRGCEHPRRALGCPGDPPAVHGREQHLGVRVAPPRDAAEGATGGRRVVDLTVVDRDVPPAGRSHGLGALGREVDDREPAVAEREARVAVAPRARRVGPAVREGVRHPADERRQVTSAGRRRPESGNTTHARNALNAEGHCPPRRRPVRRES